MGWEQDVNSPGRLIKRLSSSRYKAVVTSLHGQCRPNHIRKKELIDFFNNHPFFSFCIIQLKKYSSAFTANLNPDDLYSGNIITNL